MRTLLVDNHDSYTWNLFHLIASVTGVEPVVVRNDAPDWSDVDLGGFDAAVISPGPGHPARSRDVGHSVSVLAREDLPVLGVCLGHQCVALAAGGLVRPAPAPRHGHLTTVRHNGTGLVAGLPDTFTAVRYHSFSVHTPLPDALVADAWAEDGVLMAMHHRHRPWWSVQFHPESVDSQYGAELIANFAALVKDFGPIRPAIRTAPAALPTRQDRRLRVHVKRLDRAVDAESAFKELYAFSGTAFWLDSALRPDGGSRFSFFGDTSGPLAEVLTYRVGDGHVRVTGNVAVAGPATAAGPVTTVERGTIFDVLRQRLTGRRLSRPDVPFDLVGGYVGYFGYELKADCGATARHRSDTPDATFLFADRYVVIDHRAGHTYLVAIGSDDQPGSRPAAEWLSRTEATLAAVPAEHGSDDLDLNSVEPIGVAELLDRGRERYMSNVEVCRGYLRAGESYEICLTNSVRIRSAVDDLVLYRRLRRMNPAPYAAFLRLPEVTVLSSSPERFLRVDRAGTAESRPIKGTAARLDDPALDLRQRERLRENAKTRAENLMIVDLVRNDLGRVCEVGSVRVPTFLGVESYATVHQLVSTIRGTLRPAVSVVDCVQACFPAGSMTGAPKLRTMELIDDLEGAPRGVYSGAIGYLGLDGTADLSVAIRTAVRHGGDLIIGAGGAVVLDSDPAEEYAEMVLKAMSTLRALTPTSVPTP